MKIITCKERKECKISVMYEMDVERRIAADTAKRYYSCTLAVHNAVLVLSLLYGSETGWNFQKEKLDGYFRRRK